MKKSSIGGACLAALLAAGCSDNAPRQVTLKPDSFYQSQRAEHATTASAGQDQTPSTPAPHAPAPVARNAPSTSPATRRAPVSLGTYLVVGTVVAQVNGTPIYADKVLDKLDTVLSLKMSVLDAAQFRRFADNEIHRQIDQEVAEEIEFAAAQRSATDEDQQLANALTVQWRQKEITRHGGSLAITRDDYLHPTDPQAQPVDFDEKVQEQFRRHMILIYYQRRVWPRVQVSAQDMRSYYDRYKNDLFTERPGVLARWIRIDVRRIGSKDAAARKAEDVYRAVTQLGADFKQLAKTLNRDFDPGLAERSGLMFPPRPKVDKNGDPYVSDNLGNQYIKEPSGHLRDMDGKTPDNEPQLLKEVIPVYQPVYIEKGTLADTKLEEAIFSLKNGQISDPVVGDGGLNYYVIKCEDKRGGVVRDFEDPKVQSQIRQTLEAEQRMQLRAKEREKLLKKAITLVDEKSIQLAVDMAMQKYHTFAGAR